MNVDNREVEVSKFIRATVGDYTVYNDKIWYIHSYSGVAVGNSKGLERKKHGERISLPNTVKLYKVVKPTGYIDI